MILGIKSEKKKNDGGWSTGNYTPFIIPLKITGASINIVYQISSCKAIFTLRNQGGYLGCTNCKADELTEIPYTYNENIYSLQGERDITFADNDNSNKYTYRF